jgi:hypothetical protein
MSSAGGRPSSPCTTIVSSGTFATEAARSVPYEPTPQEGRYIEKIVEALSNGHLTIVVGAGVSINAMWATDPDCRVDHKYLKRKREAMSWPGFLQYGLDYLVEQNLLSDAADKVERRNLLELCQPRADEPMPATSLLDAATFLKRLLGEAGKIADFFDLEFGGVYKKYIDYNANPILDILKELYNSGARFIVTNYDDLLERHFNTSHIINDNSP